MRVHGDWALAIAAHNSTAANGNIRKSLIPNLESLSSGIDNNIGCFIIRILIQADMSRRFAGISWHCQGKTQKGCVFSILPGAPRAKCKPKP